MKEATIDSLFGKRVVCTQYNQVMKSEVQIDGIFVMFGCDYEEVEGGPGNFSTAIIMDDDGRVYNIPVERVHFDPDVYKALREKSEASDG